MNRATRAAFLGLSIAAGLLVVVPWQQNFDRLGSLDRVPVPSGAKDVIASTLTLLDAGAWWRVEPDYSYFLTMHERFANRADWPILLNYGSWAFLYRGYHPTTAWPLSIAWLFLASTYFAAVWIWLIRYVELSPGFAALHAIALSAAVSVAPRDVVLLTLPLLFLYLYWRSERVTAIQIVMAIACGLAADVKVTTVIVAAVAVIAALAVDFVRSRPPVAPLVLIASVFLWHFVAGNGLRTIVEYVAGSLPYAAGYGEAHAISDFPVALPVTIYAVVASLLIAGIARQLFRSNRAIGAIVLIATLAVLASYARTTFTRYDAWHASLAPALLCTSVLLLVPQVSLIRRHPLGLPVVLLCAVAAIWSHTIRGSELVRQLRAAVTPIRQIERSDGLFTEEMQSIRRMNPLPPLAGTVDFIGQRQAVIFANGLRYQPRPVFQSYIAATPALSERNRRALSSADSPQWLVFEPMMIDKRYAAMEDAGAWFAILEHYEPVTSIRSMTIFRRLQHRRVAVMTQRTTESHAVGSVIPVRSKPGEIVRARIVIRRTLTGRLRALLWKPPRMFMDVMTSQGKADRWSINPSIAAGGFLLSPVVTRASDLALIDSPMADRVPIVRALAIATEPSRFQFVEPTVTVEAETLGWRDTH